jgi:hypothetical protein
MTLFSDIEDFYYSIYRIQFRQVMPSKLILYFRDEIECLELGTDELDNPATFCDQYRQKFHLPAPHFDINTWKTFVKMLFERAQ